MSYHEGSNWQANKEDRKEPLYPLDGLVNKNVDRSKQQLGGINRAIAANDSSIAYKMPILDEIGLLFDGDRELALKCVKLFRMLREKTPLELSDIESKLHHK